MFVVLSPAQSLRRWRGSRWVIGDSAGNSSWGEEPVAAAPTHGEQVMDRGKQQEPKFKLLHPKIKHNHSPVLLCFPNLLTYIMRSASGLPREQWLLFFLANVNAQSHNKYWRVATITVSSIKLILVENYYCKVTRRHLGVTLQHFPVIKCCLLF